MSLKVKRGTIQTPFIPIQRLRGDGFRVIERARPRAGRAEASLGVNRRRRGKGYGEGVPFPILSITKVFG